MRYEVVLDWGETVNKCTIAPLAYRSDFRLIGVPRRGPLRSLRADWLLHPDGECITILRTQAAPATPTLAAVDCVWRRLPKLLERLPGTLPRLVRIPEGFVTAYPRKSEIDADPQAGLATIEAIFVAAALLGNWDTTLLSEYYFGRAFVERNARLLEHWGIEAVRDPARWPVLNRKPRSSDQRKADRKVGFPAGIEI